MSQIYTVTIPDLGGIDQADVIEVPVQVGQSLQKEETLVILESDKASMEVPTPVAGILQSLSVKMGETVKEGQEIAVIELTNTTVEPELAVIDQPAEAKPTTQPATHSPAQQQAVRPPSALPNSAAKVHAGPAVRKLARQLSVDLGQVTASGPKSRILKEDVHRFVSEILSRQNQTSAALQNIDLPDIDHGKWGLIKEEPLSRIQQISAAHLQRSASLIPHVTQFDEADITELETFRQNYKEKLAKKGIKLTPLAFMCKALALTLEVFPKFKASLKPDGKTLVHKEYCHIGVAVDTPEGLVVPVLRSVETKTVSQIAAEVVELSLKAREKKLKPDDMKGGCFSVSSLGGIGGSHFTPIINWPEVSILGISKTKTTAVWQQEAWSPRLVVPLSLSYDHRVIDGVDAARFITHFKGLLEDVRTWVL